MKKRSAFLLVLTLCAASLGPVAKAAPQKDTAGASAVVRVSAGDTELIYDEASGNVVLRRKAGAETYHAFPPDAEEDPYAAGAAAEKLRSLLCLTYGNASGVLTDMNSRADALPNGVEVAEKRNGFALRFVFGTPERVAVPMAVGVRTLNKVLKALQNDPEAAARIKAAYEYKNLAKIEDEFERDALSEKYPGLKNTDFFVCVAEDEEELSALDRDFKKAGFTAEAMDAEHRRLKYKDTREPKPWFKMTLEFELKDGDLLVTLPRESISYDTEHFRLYKAVILPYFNSPAADSGGYVFVPDRSGRILEADGGPYGVAALTGKVYGRDYADFDDDAATVPFSLPLFVTKNGASAVLTQIESGAASGSITAEAPGFSHNRLAAYASFTYQHRVRFETAGADSEFTLFEEGFSTPDAVLRYRFVDGGDLFAVAGVCRDSVFDENDRVEGALPLLLTTLGAVRTEETFLFFRVDKMHVLTDFQQNRRMLDRLREAGVPKTFVELAGITAGGLDHKALIRYSILRGLGGEKGLRDLAEYAESVGSRIFPRADLSFVGQTAPFDGYAPRRCANRTVDGKVAVRPLWDLAAGRESLRDVLPTVSSATALKYFDRVRKTLDKTKVSGVSLHDLGNTVGSDFKSSAGGRDRQADDSERLISGADRAVWVRGANAYALGADVFAQIPYDATEIEGFGRRVPFLQAVLHGRKEYSCESFNFAEDLREAVLRSIEAGASPEFVALWQNARALRKSPRHSDYYSCDFEFWLPKIAEAYREIESVLGPVRRAEMVGYEILRPGVTATRYSDGKTVYVNFTDRAVEVENRRLEPRSAAVGEGIS